MIERFVVLPRIHEGQSIRPSHLPKSFVVLRAYTLYYYSTACCTVFGCRVDKGSTGSTLSGVCACVYRGVQTDGGV